MLKGFLLFPAKFNQPVRLQTAEVSIEWYILLLFDWLVHEMSLPVKTKVNMESSKYFSFDSHTITFDVLNWTTLELKHINLATVLENNILHNVLQFHVNLI